MFDLAPFLTAVTVHYFWETVQSTIGAPAKPTALQHPDAVGNAAAVAVEDKGDVWYIPDPTTQYNHPDHLTHFLWFWSVFFTLAAHHIHSICQWSALGRHRKSPGYKSLHFGSSVCSVFYLQDNITEVNKHLKRSEPHLFPICSLRSLQSSKSLKDINFYCL